MLISIVCVLFRKTKSQGKMKTKTILLLLLLLPCVLNAKDFSVTGGCIVCKDSRNDVITIDTLALSVPLSYVQNLLSGTIASEKDEGLTEEMINTQTRYLWAIVVVIVLFVIGFILFAVAIFVKKKSCIKKMSCIASIAFILLISMIIALCSITIIMLTDPKLCIKWNATQLAIIPPALIFCLTQCIYLFLRFLEKDEAFKPTGRI